MILKSLNPISKKVPYLLFLSVLLPLQLSAQIHIQAEDYSAMAGVQTEGTTDDGGGINVGWIDNNDWMEYDVNIPLTGDYKFTFRSASLNGGGTLNIAVGGSSLANVSISSTGAWQSWISVASIPVALVAGEQKIRLKAINGGFNLNWFEIKLTSPDDSDIPTTPVIIDSLADVHSIQLSWNSSKDTSTIVTGYKLFNNTEFIAFESDTSFQITNLPPETTFDLKVYACDLAGNLSSPAQISMATVALYWELVWADEFSGNAVDRSKWNFQTGGGGWGNGEAQYYTDGANSSVSGGYLTIEVRKENYGGNQFTSSRMNSSNKGDFIYGRVDVRAKLPKTGGTWPAIWTLPTDWVYGSWPDCGEIDIMEHAGNNLGYVFGTVHTGAYNHADGTQQGGGVWWSDVADAFHTYSLEWYPDHLDWYYDDQLVFTFQNEYNSSAEWPYDIEHHILLNVAVGGGLGGDINYNGTWPQQMIVDYVRIYDFDLGSGDTIAPGTPSELNAQVSGINVDLSWTRSNDNKYIEKYYIFNNDVMIDSVSGTSYQVQNLEPTTSYTFSVQAKDFAGNLSEKVNITTSTEEIDHIPIPGKFQAEAYLYMEGMQTEKCTDTGGGLNVAYIDPSDWLEYSIDVSSAGTYYLITRAASESLKGRFQLLDENDNELARVETPVTGGWQKWTTVVSDGFNMNEGIQRIKINSLAREFNLNWFDITSDSSKYFVSAESMMQRNDRIYPNPLTGKLLTIDLVDNSEDAVVCIYSIDGSKVFSNKFERGQSRIVVDDLTLIPGVYLLTVSQGKTFSHYKLVSEQ